MMLLPCYIRSKVGKILVNEIIITCYWLQTDRRRRLSVRVSPGVGSGRRRRRRGLMELIPCGQTEALAFCNKLTLTAKSHAAPPPGVQFSVWHRSSQAEVVAR